MLKSFVTGFALSIMIVPAAFAAADADHPEASVRQLISRGFHIVATQEISSADAKSAGMNTDIPTTIVTLQKGTSVAVCTFGSKAWIYMQDGQLELPTTCDYRDYSKPTPPPAVAAALSSSSNDSSSSAPSDSGSSSAPSSGSDSSTPPANSDSGSSTPSDSGSSSGSGSSSDSAPISGHGDTD